MEEDNYFGKSGDPGAEPRALGAHVEGQFLDAKLAHGPRVTTWHYNAAGYARGVGDRDTREAAVGRDMSAMRSTAPPARG